jgi:hypothetical protein
MVTNAKTFNDKNSAIYLDAERVRKTASNWMVKNNPAYRNPGYQAAPTPIPDGATALPSTNGANTNVMTKMAGTASSERPRRGAAVKEVPVPPSPTPAPKNKAASSKAATNVGQEDSEFAGLTFQQAQEQILENMLTYIDEE